MPGSGKSTQCERWVERGWKWVSSSNVIRTALESGKLSPSYAEKMARGEYLNDEEMISVMGDHLSGVPLNQNIILDGFSRTAPQARFLIGYLRAHGYDLYVIVLELPPEDAAKRIPGREAKDKRPDDNQVVLEKRIIQHDKENKGHLAYLLHHVRDHIYIVPATPGPDEVFDDICDRVGELRTINLAESCSGVNL